MTNASAQPATIVHNRNRTYSPALGRFLQPDPLASGQTVADGDVRPPGVRITPLDLGFHHADGLNRYFAHGGNPIGHRDPAGLFFSSLDLAMTGVDTLDSMHGIYAQLHQGKTIKGQLEDIFDEYSINQLFMIEWILDWDTAKYDGGTSMVSSGASGMWAMAANMMTDNRPYSGRPDHGKGWHAFMLRAMNNHYVSKVGQHNVRTHLSAGYDSRGKRVMPDLLVRKDDGTWLAFEVEDTNPVDVEKRRTQIAQALGVSEGDVKVHPVNPRNAKDVLSRHRIDIDISRAPPPRRRW